MTPPRTRRAQDGLRQCPWLLATVGWLLLSSLTCACRSRNNQLPVGTAASAPAAAEPHPPEVEQVLLTGSFERVSRKVSGKASIVRHGDSYELRLQKVDVAQTGPVRVYLVGHERADTTRIVDETEMKYDMAELERGVPEQRILLPSAPDPALLSVVLYLPSFGVNLAVAPLKPASLAR